MKNLGISGHPVKREGEGKWRSSISHHISWKQIVVHIKLVCKIIAE
jgi:hypothetical protein